jgi:hypothetical protein
MASELKEVQNCHILRLPAELRNTIYELVLDEHSAKQLWPDILSTCTQIRAEALPIHLAQITSISIKIESRNIQPLVAALRHFATLTQVEKQCLLKLTISTDTDVWVTSDKKGKLIPDFSTWSVVVATIKDAGIAEEQLSWPNDGVVCYCDDSTKREKLQHEARLAVEKRLFEDAVIRPLMLAYGFKPANVRTITHLKGGLAMWWDEGCHMRQVELRERELGTESWYKNWLEGVGHSE